MLYLRKLSVEHIDRNIVIRHSGFDDDWTLLLLVGWVVLNTLLSTGWCAFIPVDCGIVFIGKCPPKLRTPVV